MLSNWHSRRTGIVVLLRCPVASSSDTAPHGFEKSAINVELNEIRLRNMEGGKVRSVEVRRETFVAPSKALQDAAALFEAKVKQLDDDRSTLVKRQNSVFEARLQELEEAKAQGLEKTAVEAKMKDLAERTLALEAKLHEAQHEIILHKNSLRTMEVEKASSLEVRKPTIDAQVKVLQEAASLFEAELKQSEEEKSTLLEQQTIIFEAKMKELEDTKVQELEQAATEAKMKDLVNETLALEAKLHETQ